MGVGEGLIERKKQPEKGGGRKKEEERDGKEKCQKEEDVGKHSELLCRGGKSGELRASEVRHYLHTKNLTLPTTSSQRTPALLFRTYQ